MRLNLRYRFRQPWNQSCQKLYKITPSTYGSSLGNDAHIAAFKSKKWLMECGIHRAMCWKASTASDGLVMIRPGTQWPTASLRPTYRPPGLPSASYRGRKSPFWCGQWAAWWWLEERMEFQVEVSRRVWSRHVTHRFWTLRKKNQNRTSKAQHYNAQAIIPSDFDFQHFQFFHVRCRDYPFRRIGRKTRVPHGFIKHIHVLGFLAGIVDLFAAFVSVTNYHIKGAWDLFRGDQLLQLSLNLWRYH